MTRETLTIQVENVLRKYERARNDDTFLTLKIWGRYYKHDFDADHFIEHGSMYSLPRASTIERCRRKIQGDTAEMIRLFRVSGMDRDNPDVLHMYEVMPTDPIVIARRKMLEQEWRHWAKT